jgi:hypothetical protein
MVLLLFGSEDERAGESSHGARGVRVALDLETVNRLLAPYCEFELETIAFLV